MTRGLFTAAVVIGATSCTVGPNYRRPPLSIPQVYRGETPAGAVSPSFGDVGWEQVFHDPVLHDLIRTALARNYNLRITASRILQAEAQLGITRSQQFPELGATVDVSRQKSPRNPVFRGFTANSFSIRPAASWVLDFWGQYRRATEAARAALLASEYGLNFVRVTLVSDVASTYFQLLAADLQLRISRETLRSRQDSLRLTQIREQGGVGTMLDVRQAESLVETAQTTITETTRRIQLFENAISVLLGENPRAIPRGKPLTDLSLAPTLPPGLPSSLLERRPDIREAEQTLVAANAQIGVARAAFFPQITLTTFAGLASPQLSSLFNATTWGVAADLFQPVFTGGRLRSQLRLTRAQAETVLLNYQSTIQNAFREVSDALISYQQYQQFTREQEALTKTLEDADRLARLRYRGGVTSYLEVLQQETQYFSAELGLADARLNQLNAVVQLYQALGGGWR